MKFITRTGPLLVVTFLAFMSLTVSLSHAAKVEFRSICVIRDNTRVDCISGNAIQAILGEKKYQLLAERLHTELQRHNSKIGSDFIYRCSTNGDIGGIASKSTNVGAEEMLTMVVRCAASVATDIGLNSNDLRNMVKGAKPSALNNVFHLEAKYASCTSDMPGSMPIDGGNSQASGPSIFDLWDVLTLESDSPTAKQKEREAEEKRQEANAKAYEDLLNRQYLERLRREMEAEEERKKQQKPKPATDGKVESRGTTTSSPGSGLGDHVAVPPCDQCAIVSCIDEACAPTCKEAQLAWFNFKNQCGQSSWSSYTCLTFVNMANGCPDSALILPTPDGDHKCGRQMTSAEMAELRKKICEKRQGLMNPGPDGGLARCSEKARTFVTFQPGHLCNDPRALWREESCLKSAGLPTGTKISRKGRTPPLPKERGAASAHYRSRLDLYLEANANHQSGRSPK